MECHICGRRITRGRKLILITIARRHRIGYGPVGDEAPLCSRACAARLLAGDGFLAGLLDLPLGQHWPDKPAR
jgi:hypothetical protein